MNRSASYIGRSGLDSFCDEWVRASGGTGAPVPETRKLRVQKTVAGHVGAASGSLCESGRPVGPASVLSRGAVRAEWKKGSPARVPDCPFSIPPEPPPSKEPRPVRPASRSRTSSPMPHRHVPQPFSAPAVSGSPVRAHPYRRSPGPIRRRTNPTPNDRYTKRIGSIVPHLPDIPKRFPRTERRRSPKSETGGKENTVPYPTDSIRLFHTVLRGTARKRVQNE